MSFLVGTDPGLRQTRTPTVDTLLDTVGFTAGSSTTITLSDDPGQEAHCVISFDGVTQHRSTYSISSTTVTFNAAIPSGVAEIEATFTVTVASTTVPDLSVTTAKIVTNSVDETLIKDAFVADFTEVVVTASDSVLIGDATDSGNTKRDTVQGILDLVPSAGITLGTEQATTSGSAVTFTGIPSGTKRITGMIVGVSSNGTGVFNVTIGDSGGLETSGYLGGGVGIADAEALQALQATTSFQMGETYVAASAYHGSFVLTLQDSSDNTWTFTSISSSSTGTVKTMVGGGSKPLSGELTQLAFNTPDTFDAGVINISYE